MTAEPRPPRPLEAVLLDVGGVFLLPSPDWQLPAMRAAGADPDPDTLRRAHYAGTAAMDAVGHGEWERYCTTVARVCGVPAAAVPDVAAEIARGLAGGAAAWGRVIDGAVDALRGLAATGVALAVVSNADGTIAEQLLVSRIAQVGAGAGVPVEIVVDSGVVGIDKPDPGIFAVALDHLGVEPAAAAHVGDTAHADVDGALAAGIRPLHLDPYRDCPHPAGHEHVRDLDDVTALVAASRR